MKLSFPPVEKSQYLIASLEDHHTGIELAKCSTCRRFVVPASCRFMGQRHIEFFKDIEYIQDVVGYICIRIQEENFIIRGESSRNFYTWSCRSLRERNPVIYLPFESEQMARG